MSDFEVAWQTWRDTDDNEWHASPISRSAFDAGATAALEIVAKEIAELVPYGYGMNPDGTEDRTAAAYLEGHREAWQVVTNRLKALSSECGCDEDKGVCCHDSDHCYCVEEGHLP